mmetsp:Transcript_21462/g.63564  ORF Transcript_21462/g.63564 Transcript_21462/m.63564 type:complete len:105 (-) Transcript_21462:798-1112(-)
MTKPVPPLTKRVGGLRSPCLSKSPKTVRDAQAGYFGDRSNKTQVIVYRTNRVHQGKYHGRHCVFLPADGYDKDEKVWIGLNSWGLSEMRPMIPCALTTNCTFMT